MASDKEFMERALTLARQGAGLVSPNPMVGAVLVREDRIVGEGFHRYDLLKHAESYAIETAGPLSRGATLYCSLEPCCHQGRTPPCTDALIRAGIRRAVIAMADPNPRVSGQGIDQLRAAGIQVEVGLLEKEAIKLNECYVKYVRQGVPFVHRVFVNPAESSKQGPVGLSAESERASAWQPSSPLREMASQYDAVVLGGFPGANRSIVDACLSRHRHRPLIIAGARDSISQLIRDQSLDTASVRDAGALEAGSISTKPIAGSDAIFVEMDLGDQGFQRIRGTNQSNLSGDLHSGGTAIAPEFDSLLGTLAGMQVTSVLVLPYANGLPLDSAGPGQVDRLTLVREVREQVPGQSGGDPLSEWDSLLDCSVVHETSDFIEVTGRCRASASRRPS